MDDQEQPSGFSNCAQPGDISSHVISVVQPLSDLAARITGKYYPCKFLESHDPPLDEALIKKIAFWAFPQSENRIVTYAELINKKEDEWEALIDNIKDIIQVGFMVLAKFHQPGNYRSGGTIYIHDVESAKVSVSFEKHQITLATCTYCRPSTWCSHIVSVIIYRIRNANKIAVHAPLTEVLCTLDRNQIQKLVQYAVSEDPVGIGCGIFKFMDKIRDSRSELIKTQGAPDPSFGVTADQKSSLALLVEQLNQDFKYNVAKLIGSQQDLCYEDTCNFVKKAKTTFYCNYIKKILALVGVGDLDSAANILINLAKTTLNEIINQHDSKCLLRFCHDIERLFTCFVVYFKGEIRDTLGRAAMSLNSFTQAKNTSVGFLKASEWSDLGSIPLENYVSSRCKSRHNSSSEGVFGASREHPFYQVLCARLIPTAPDSLDDLLCGKHKPLTTTYDEKLPVMLLRFEALMHLHLEMKNHTKRLYNLGLVILRKLLNLSKQFSVIGCDKVLESSCEESDENETISKVTTTKRKRKQKSRPRKKTRSVLCQDVTEVDMEGMSKAQISYALLLVCYTLYQMKDLVSLGLEGIPVILDATFRALEHGRFRPIAPQNAITSEDYSWLEFLENEIQESYFKLGDSNSAIRQLKGEIIQKYTTALQEHQASYYGDHYAVGLLSFLLKDSQLDDKTAQMLSLEGVCHSTSPLQNLTIPADQSYRSDNHDKMMRRWKLVVKRIFSGFLDDKVNNNAVVSKFLTYTESLDDPKFADLVYRVIYETYVNEFTLPEQRISWCKFLLQVNKHCRSEVSPYMVYKSLVEIGQEIQPEFLGLILPRWQELNEFLEGDQLTQIVKVMEDYIKSVDGLPEKTIDLLMGYFQAPLKHTEECTEFLKCFHAQEHRHEALETVISNEKNYTTLALLLLAKVEHEKMDSSTLPLGDIFTEIVFWLIQQVFKRLQEEMDSSGEEQEMPSSDVCRCFLWFFGKISDCGKCGKHGKEIANGLQFATFMNDIKTTVKNNSSFLVSFFTEMEKSKPLFNRAKQVLGEHLIGTYQRQFKERLQNCQRSSYEYVLQEMREARNTSIQYVNKGSDLFKSSVTDSIRKLHRNKKKFLQIMDTDFRELCKNS